jgi:hypothetical protein
MRVVSVWPTFLRMAMMADHHCHWPGCPRVVPPRMWGCREHWFRLPSHLRKRIWQTYEPGQEIAKTPSSDYIAAAKAVQAWIAKNAQGDLFG